MAKRLPDPYYPTNPPERFEDWPRWITDEHFRIQQDLIANPVLMGLENSGTINIAPAPAVFVRLGIGVIPTVENPDGAWDPIVAEYVIPQDGTYIITVKATIQPFGIGNKSYYGQIDTYRNGILIDSSLGSALDDVPLTVNANINTLARSPDRYWFEFAAVHEQFTGTSTFDMKMSFLRVAG